MKRSGELAGRTCRHFQNLTMNGVAAAIVELSVLDKNIYYNGSIIVIQGCTELLPML